MLTTYEDIKSRIVESFGDDIAPNADEPDRLSELADSEVPVYTGDVIREWTELSSEDSDRWHELGEISPSTTIDRLMAIDLYLYYLGQFSIAWSELCEEAEESAEYCTCGDCSDTPIEQRPKPIGADDADA